MSEKEIILEEVSNEEQPVKKKNKKKKKEESHVIAIVCTDTNYGIGYKNELLFHIPDDMKHFSRVTTNGYVIMGRKTYESLPNGPLPKRTNIVITREPTTTMDNLDFKEPNYVSMDEIKDWLITQRENKSQDKIAIIGGAQIYEELLPYCDYIYITKVFAAAENVDTHFPNLDKMQLVWDMCYAGEIEEYEGIKYQYRRYKNTKPVKREKPKKTTKKTKTIKKGKKES